MAIYVTICHCRGQRSLVSTTLGLIMYLRSPSEFSRYSIGEETRWAYGCICEHFIFVVMLVALKYSLASQLKESL